MQTIKPSLLDRLVASVSPAAGVERLRARSTFSMLTGGYKGGARDRRPTRNWRPRAGDADADQALDLPDLRARSRDLVRGDMIGGGAIATNTTNVVGSGLMVLPIIDRDVVGLTEDQADAWETAAAREFSLWCKTADATGVQSFEEMQQLAFRASMESGDVFALRRYRDREPTTYKTRIQLIEADRVCNPGRISDKPELTGGVAMTADGTHLGYHVANEHPGDRLRSPNAWRFVPRQTRDGQWIMLHVFERLRPDQTRGVPYLAPVIEALKQFGDYTDAEVTAAVMSSMFTVFITTPEGDPEVGPFGGEEAADGNREFELGAGAIVNLAEGEVPQFAAPTRPNAAFNAFAEAFLSHVGVALELPFELLVKRFTASYSASRAALEMAHAMFIKKRAWFATRFCQPIYEVVITEAVLIGRLEAPLFFDRSRPEIRHAYLQADWIGPARPYLDPLKEAKADAQDIETRVKSRTEVIIERTGGTLARKHRQLVKEKRLADRDGLHSPQPAPSALVRSDEPDEETEE